MAFKNLAGTGFLWTWDFLKSGALVDYDVLKERTF